MAPRVLRARSSKVKHRMSDSVPPPQSEPQALQIHHRTEVSPGGGARTSGYVACPRVRGTVPLRRCLTCERFEGFCAVRGELAVEPGLPSHLSCDAGAPALEQRPPSVPAERTAVARVMTRSVVCVREDLSVGELAALLVERGINAVPVVDETGDAIGIVSKADVLREHYAALEVAPALPAMKSWDYDLGPVSHALGGIERATVAEIMMPVVFTVAEDVSVESAAALMAQKGVHQLPVVSASGDVVGIVSSLDLLAWFAAGRSDGSAERAMRRA